jgi:DNA-binding PadR family transcriptional regulator
MFDQLGKRFAFQFRGAPEADWTPPWLNDPREWSDSWRSPFRVGPRFFRMRFGHGPFGHKGPFGPEGPMGKARRFFGRGDLKFALLELLQERPMHGYEMMKALEEKSGGFYAPSAGSVYPTLQMLEDRGLVTVSEVEGKKVYSITDAGRAALEEHKKEQEPQESFKGAPWERGFGPGRHGFPEMQALHSEAREVARLFAIAGRMSFRDPEQIKRLREIIERTRKDLSDMIYGTATEAKEAESKQE